MRKFIEKAIIVFFSLYATYTLNTEMDLAFYFLISVVLSLALDLLNHKKYRYIVYLGFLLLLFYDTMFLFYFPLILYNFYSDFKIYTLFSLPLLFLNLHPIILILSALSIYLSHSTWTLEKILIENRHVRDNLKEDTLYLKKYNEQLKLDREKTIHIAILTERNRIAREIHDSIGHAISSSILQVKALKILSKGDLEEPLDLLQDSLNNGMNDIRKSLKDLRDESFDLRNKIEVLIDETPSLHILLKYNMEEDIDYNLKFDMLSIIKEAITNTIKHSNATSLNINLFSQPKFYSLIIEDNGNIRPSFEDKGIGLDYMGETANKYNGIFNYKFENGFKIHVTFMKGE